MQPPHSAIWGQGRGAWALEEERPSGGDAGAAGDGGADRQVREGSFCGGRRAGAGVEGCPVGAREATWGSGGGNWKWKLSALVNLALLLPCSPGTALPCRPLYWESSCTRSRRRRSRLCGAVAVSRD